MSECVSVLLAPCILDLHHVCYCTCTCSNQSLGHIGCYVYWIAVVCKHSNHLESPGFCNHFVCCTLYEHHWPVIDTGLRTLWSDFGAFPFFKIFVVPFSLCAVTPFFSFLRDIL